MDIDVKVTDNSNEILKSLDHRIPIILEACGLEAEKFAKQDDRVDTGRYRASITHTVSGTEARVHQYRDDSGKGFTEELVGVPENERAVYVGTNVEYALVLESKDHTIKNSIADHIEHYKKIIKDGMKVE